MLSYMSLEFFVIFISFLSLYISFLERVTIFLFF
ncbi:unnamed protein product [Spirodela intermedia]|uniref:Uncharacterized protein n=1 Tax=Spirodela intermedia TaxID=51605 RepID=A0A7I8J0C1_SPIIN|nr:unnamed protein product [Spirodela intermedia]CAA6663273.1 unnamed protein product [Spirodela intermedia]